MTDPLTEAVARIIANAMGDNFADAFKNQARWIAKRGQSGGRFRAVNEPMQEDYLSAAQAAIAAMRDQLVPQWQPIETAPRDGTSILLLAHGMAIEGRFCPGEWSHTMDGDEYDGPVWSAFDDAVTFEIEEMGPLPADMHHGPVTHWMPLPDAPTEGEE